MKIYNFLQKRKEEVNFFDENTNENIIGEVTKKEIC